jgi:hypothetical protein
MKIPGEIRMNVRIKKFLFVLCVLSISVVSCVSIPSTGRVLSQSDEVNLDGAEIVQAEILMGAGKLVVKDGTSLLMEGDFTYSHREYAPDIDYRVRSNDIGILEIKQENKPGLNVNTNFRNDWILRFNEDVLLDLDVTLGAGECDLDLSALNLASFKLQMGAGEANVDLNGEYLDDLDVDIQGGVGELTVLLPADMNLEVDVQGGLGGINTSGLDRDGNLYVSEYSGSGPMLYISISAGIGELNLLVQ